MAGGLVALDEVGLLGVSGPVEVLDLAVQDGLSERVEGSVVGQRSHRHHGLVEAGQQLGEVVLENLNNLVIRVDVLWSNLGWVHHSSDTT